MSKLHYLMAAVLVLLLVALPPAVWNLTSARSTFLAATSQLRECQQFANRISRLQAKPELVSLQRRSESQIHADIVTSAERNNLPILRISSPVSSQIPNSPYVEQSTSLDTNPVELQQLIRFLKDLTAGDEKHDIAAIRLTEPRMIATQASQADTWTVELTITSWTYAKR